MSLGDLRALAHPVRLQIMSLLTGAELTAAEVARELGLTHANSSYHLRNLLAAGLITVAGEEKIRGGMAKRYRYEVRGADSEKPLDPDERRAELAAVANELIRRSAEATFARPAVALMADGDLWVEPEVWKSVRDRIAAAVTDLHHAALPPRTPGTVRTSTTVALYRNAGDPE